MNNKYVSRPKSDPIAQQARYEQYNLQENPFPASPFVNPESNDARSNGDIYEPSIRVGEYGAIKTSFLAVPQSDPNHLRLGYIIDTSYIGRGNGKSAFLVNLHREINQDFALSISNGLNKCFALTVVPQPGGKTKTFESFVELFADGVFRSSIIEDCLITLRLDAILSSYKDFDIQASFTDEADIRAKLSDKNWFTENKIDFRLISQQIASNKYLNNLPKDFPLQLNAGPLLLWVPSQNDFFEYYKNLKRGKPKYEFVFSHLVSFFLAAGFNGSYIFVDDFERIPDFQSERQKRDFALELRTCLFDGLYTNAKMGFYNFILILHAGVPRLIQDAWDQSGLEQRSPISFKGTPKNVIRFEKITIESALSLVTRYLQAYRINPTEDMLFPFTKNAIVKIAELSEYNASKILKMSYEVLERARDQSILKIDADFVLEHDDPTTPEQKQSSGIHDKLTKNLMQESD